MDLRKLKTLIDLVQASGIAEIEINEEGDHSPASAASTKYNASKPSSVSPKWNAGAGDEEKLERIITQKWIAMFPNGQEAWSEFRRTGYPKVIPIVNNLSGGKVDTNVQVRRMTFPRSEYSNNAAGVAAATALLGGADTGGTKLWWDKK